MFKFSGIVVGSGIQVFLWKTLFTDMLACRQVVYLRKGPTPKTEIALLRDKPGFQNSTTSSTTSHWNKRTTHPLAVATGKKTIELRNLTSITFHWVKGHAGLSGNERADYLARTAASYNTIIAYNAIPLNRGKQLLEEYYTKIWKAKYTNSTNASHIKQFIPTISHRLSISLRPNFNLTQFLTNHGGFRSYLHKMKKASSPTCICPERELQKAKHLMTECSLLAPNRPAVLHNLPPYQILKHHIHTVNVSNFLSDILHSLQK